METYHLSEYIEKLEEERNYRKQMLRLLKSDFLSSEMTLRPDTFLSMSITGDDLHPDFISNKKHENEKRLEEIETMFQQIISILKTNKEPICQKLK